MRNKFKLILVTGMLCLSVSGLAEAAKKGVAVDREDLYGSEPFFMTEWLTSFLSWERTYKLNYDIDSLRNQLGECLPNESENLKAYAGRGSVYHVNTRHYRDELEYVEFEYVAPVQVPPAKVARAEVNKPYYLCKDSNITSPNYYQQVGGVTTGITIIPLKIRNDFTLSGDSSIGPYVGLSGDEFTLMGVFGFTQLTIPVSTTGSELETRTGLTVAAGINWKVKEYFNIGLVGGIDHVAGDAGDRFTYQDKPWGSFSIGYTFTR